MLVLLSLFTCLSLIPDECHEIVSVKNRNCMGLSTENALAQCLKTYTPEVTVNGCNKALSKLAESAKIGKMEFKNQTWINEIKQRTLRVDQLEVVDIDEMIAHKAKTTKVTSVTVRNNFYDDFMDKLSETIYVSILLFCLGAGYSVGFLLALPFAFMGHFMEKWKYFGSYIAFWLAVKLGIWR